METVMMRQWVDAIEPGCLNARPIAVFDTRYRMSEFLTGSAGRAIARQLCADGARLVVPVESFFVTRDEQPVLVDWEAERAASWAEEIAREAEVALAYPAVERPVPVP